MTKLAILLEVDHLQGKAIQVPLLLVKDILARLILDKAIQARLLHITRLLVTNKVQKAAFLIDDPSQNVNA